jgi:uncharacterized protein (DUF2249 family)
MRSRALLWQTVASRRLLDARSIPAVDRTNELLSAFDALRPHETLTLISAEDPRSYLRELQAKRRGLFEWSPGLGESTSWQVDIARRNAGLGSLRCVTEALAWDHDRLDALAGAAFQAGKREGARRLFAVYRHAFDRHLRAEEEVLFPVFEMRAGLPHGGPTAVLRAEHRHLRILVAQIAKELEGGPSVVATMRLALENASKDHYRKEELILYPGTDRLLTEAERDTLVARVQALA